MSIRLLLCDGDPATGRMLEASFARYGFVVTHALDGDDAVALFKPRAFDVVLLDVALPRRDGFQVANTIRTLPGGNQVGLVMVSGSTASPDAMKLLRRAQVDAWFHKPLPLRDLRDKLAELAHRHTGATSDTLQVALGRDALREQRSRAPEKPAAAAPAPVKAAPRPACVRVPAPTPVPTPPPPPMPGVPLPPEPLVVPISAAERPAPKGPPLDEHARPINELHASARMLLALARAQVTGVYHLSGRDAEAKVAFIQGVMVGAADSSPDNRLLARLVRRQVLEEAGVDEVMEYAKEHRLRAAEAVLAMELCDAGTLLDELERQTFDRLVLAAAWRDGAMRFVQDAAEVERLAISSFDAYAAVLHRFDTLSDPVMVRAWVEGNGKRGLTTSKDFEDGLVAYARLAPTSPLPGILFSRPPDLAALTGAIAGGADERERLLAHVYGMWVAGLLRLDDDEVADDRPVPRPVRSADVERVVPDKDAVERMRAEWLRAQGRSYYDVMGIDPAAEDVVVREALADYLERWGREAFAGKKLGPVEGLAEDLWALLDDMQATLPDEAARRAYDATLRTDFDEGSLEDIDAETDFLEGKVALAAGDLAQAKESFELAAGHAPEDVDYRSYLSWVYFLEGAALVEDAMGALKAAAQRNPTSARPMLLVALAHERLGAPNAAKPALEEALRRDPDDMEARAALLRIDRSLTPEE